MTSRTRQQHEARAPQRRGQRQNASYSRWGCYLICVGVLPHVRAGRVQPIENAIERMGGGGRVPTGACQRQGVPLLWFLQIGPSCRRGAIAAGPAPCAPDGLRRSPPLPPVFPRKLPRSVRASYVLLIACSPR